MARTVFASLEDFEAVRALEDGDGSGRFLGGCKTLFAILHANRLGSSHYLTKDD